MSTRQWLSEWDDRFVVSVRRAMCLVLFSCGCVLCSRLRSRVIGDEGSDRGASGAGAWALRVKRGAQPETAWVADV